MDEKNVMQEILDNTDAILYSADKEGKITHFNKAALQTTYARRGTPIELGEYWPDLVSGESGLNREKMVQLLNYVLAGNKFKIIEDVIVGQGHRLTYSVQASPMFNDKQEVVGAVLCAQDITQISQLQREAEEKAQQRNEELERWNQFYDMLLAVLAHDLRQPLSVVVMTADLFNHPSKHFNEEDIRSIMKKLRNSSAKSIEVLQGLLHWIKSKRENFQYEPSPLNLYKLIEEANSLIIPDQIAKNITFDNQIPEDQMFYAHEQMALFVFRNLISNACRHSFENTSIKISTKIKGNEIIIMVQDQGKGMSQEQITKLFNIQDTREDDYIVKGAGMALTIVHDMLNQMKSRIHAESNPNQGTTFYVTMPNLALK